MDPQNPNINQPTNPPQQVSLPQTSPTPWLRTLTIALLAVFVLSSVGLGAYFLGKNQVNLSQLMQSEDPTSNWLRKQFGSSWNIKYPSTWNVNEVGLIEGTLKLTGEYKNSSYEITLGYPKIPFENSLDELVESQLADVPKERRNTMVKNDLLVNGAQAKKLLNIPIIEYPGAPQKPIVTNELKHAVYIWKYQGINPRSIEVRQTNGIFNSPQMEELLDLFIKEVR